MVKRVRVNDKWKDEYAWDRVKPNMTRSQVEAILGKPTSVVDYGFGVKLYYKGYVKGAGYVSGHVTISEDDHVWITGINKPVM